MTNKPTPIVVPTNEFDQLMERGVIERWGRHFFVTPKATRREKQFATAVGACEYVGEYDQNEEATPDTLKKLRKRQIDCVAKSPRAKKSKKPKKPKTAEVDAVERRPR